MAGAYLVQLPSPSVMPARQLQDGDDTYVVWANNSADALAFVQNYANKTVFAGVTPSLLAAATVMTNWSLRIRLYSAAGVLTNDFKVKAAGVAARDVLATGVLTSSANYSDTETITIGSKVYTLQTTLTNVDGHIKIGASEAATLANIAHAINGSGGTPGTDYATATTANTQVTATTDGVHVVTVTAVHTLTAAQANAVATTETSATAAWGATTLAGGVDTTDLPSSLAGLMVEKLIAAGLHASFVDSTHVLTVATIGDGIGDHTMVVDFLPPPEVTGDTSADLGVPVQTGTRIAGFFTSKVDGGVAAAVLTVTIAADTYVIPTMIAKAKVQE